MSRWDTLNDENVGRIGNPTYSCPYFLRRYEPGLFARMNCLPESLGSSPISGFSGM